jgi:hypothetical protein
MTSTVKCFAHPADGKELVVQVFELVSGEGFDDVKIIEERTLQNGETFDAVVFENRRVVSFERDKV